MSGPADSPTADPGRALPPCIVSEDDHLLVVNKPAGWNTHSPSPFAGEGIYEWLRHREPRWASLSILHRLDKETSGLLVFGKTPEANRELTRQFAAREAEKTYLLATDRPVPNACWTTETAIQRAGERYVARPMAAGGERAETRFRVRDQAGGLTWIEARPITGKTHQIRVHAAHAGCPIFGDELYGGTPAGRVHLHAAALRLRHPASGAMTSWEVSWTGDREARMPGGTASGIRLAAVARSETDALRVVHGAADGAPGVYVDRLGEFVLIHCDAGPNAKEWNRWNPGTTRGAYFRRLSRHVRGKSVAETSPQWLAGDLAPARFAVRENGVKYEVSFGEGYSFGLFLDQRDNRRRLLVNHVGAGFPLFAEGAENPEVLNCFAYTCAFSVSAALGGARTTSLDLSRKYLDWGRRNFALNGLDPDDHDFIFGDVFDWLRRLGRKGRQFDAVLLDPPTFSRSKERGDFRAESDYGGLVATALPLVRAGGVLLASTNAARLAPEEFLVQVRGAITRAGRRIVQELYVPQPPDFPVHRTEPAYLKTVWVRVD